MADHIVHEHDDDVEDKRVIHEYRDSDRGVGDGILAFLILIIVLAAIGLVVWRYLPSRASNNSSIELKLPANVNPNGSGSQGGGSGGTAPTNNGGNQGVGTY